MLPFKPIAFLFASLAASAFFGCAHVADGSSTTPLMWAAQEGDMAKVQALVAQGADVNARNIHGVSVLYHTVYHGHAEVARYLISRGAAPDDDIERRDIDRMLGMAPNAISAGVSAPVVPPLNAEPAAKQWWER